jgi:TRAP-type mannitol/chloroaromatic compound transport system permease small subunit
VNIIRRILHVVDSLSEVTGKAFGYFILVLVAIVLFEVLMRYVFRMSQMWSFETSLYVFGAFFIMGGAYLLKHEGHVKIDVLYSLLTPRGKAITDLVTSVFFFIFIGLLIWKGWDLAWRAFELGERTNSAWHPLVWPVRMLIPVGAFLVLLQGLAKFTRDLFIAIGKRGLDE